MTYLPSHNNSANERNERRQNWKNEIARTASAKRPEMTIEAAKQKFTKLAQAFIASGKVADSGNVTRVAVGGGSKFYPVYKIKDSFSCECRDSEKYGFCAHEIAATIFAAKSEVSAPRETKMICLSHRRDEFASALKRAADSDIEIFADFERDAFVAKNHANGSEYKVALKTVNGELFGGCECADFGNRRRICKHLVETVRFQFAPVFEVFAESEVCAQTF